MHQTKEEWAWQRGVRLAAIFKGEKKFLHVEISTALCKLNVTNCLSG